MGYLVLVKYVEMIRETEVVCNDNEVGIVKIGDNGRSNKILQWIFEN